MGDDIDDIIYGRKEDQITKIILDEVNSIHSLIETDISKLQKLAIEADKILREELQTAEFEYDFAEVRIYNLRTVGVQGDNRTYLHPAEVTIKHKGSFVWDAEFVSRLSTRITNGVEGINRVLYTVE